MERYTYSPLWAAREVRLLRLFAGADDDELSGELFRSWSNCKGRWQPSINTTSGAGQSNHDIVHRGNDDPSFSS